MSGILSRFFRLFNYKYKASTSKVSDVFFLNQKLKRYDIGDYTYGNPKILFPNGEAALKIGKFCSIADGVTIFLGGNHRTDWISTYPFNVVFNDDLSCSEIKGHPSTKGDVIIGNDVWIGSYVTILSGVTIGDGAVIAANAVISKNVGKYEIWGGNPAKMIRMRFTDLEIQILERVRWWDWGIDKIKRNSHLLCSGNIDQLSAVE